MFLHLFPFAIKPDRLFIMVFLYLSFFILNIVNFLNDSVLLALAVTLINLVVFLRIVIEVGIFINQKVFDNAEFVDDMIIGLLVSTIISFLFWSIGIPLKEMVIAVTIIFSSWQIWKTKNYLSFKNDFSSIPFPVWVLIFLLLLSCLVPRVYHDALSYHLLGPWLWVNDSSFETLQKYVSVFHCSFFEQLFAWGMSLQKPNLQGQIQGQLFGQLAHFIFGGYLSVILVLKILRRLGIEYQYFLALGILYLFSRLSLAQLLTVAKNDWIAITLGLFLFEKVILKTETAKLSAYLWWGGIAGYLYITKYSYIFFLVLMFISIVFHKKMTLNKGLVLILGFSIVAIPFHIRNYWILGNPVFPLFPGIFTSDILGPTWNKGFQEISQINMTLSEWIFKFYERIMAKNPLNITIFLVPLFAWKKEHRLVLTMWIIGFFSLVLLFIFSSISLTETRHSGISIMLLQISAFYFIVIGIQKLKSKELKIICCFLIMASSLFPYWNVQDQHRVIDREWAQVFSIGHEKYVEKNLGHNLLTYVRQHPSSRIYTFSDQPMYYFAPFHVIKAWDWAVLDRKLQGLKDIKHIVQTIIAQNGTHVFFNSYYFDRFHNSEAILLIKEAAEKYPASISFKTDDSYLIDLKKIQELL